MIDDLRWLVAGRILFVKYSGLVTFDEVLTSTKQLIQMAKDEGDPPFVHLIGDAVEIQEFDIRMKNMRSLMTIFSLLQRKSYLGWTLCVTGNADARFPTVNFVTVTAAKTLGVHFHATPTLRDALKFVQSTDPTLPANLAVSFNASSEEKTANC